MSTSLAAAALATTIRLVASHAYAEGAPPGFSGGFKEDSCQGCHFSETLNAAPGRVAIEGVPATFTPGERYTVTVVLSRPGMKMAGFQLAARFEDGTGQAGTLAPGSGEGDRIAVETSGPIQYAGQRKAGAALVSGDVAKWTVEWTAPERGGPVIFHVSANAANGNGNAEGDFIYTVTAKTAPP